SAQRAQTKLRLNLSAASRARLEGLSFRAAAAATRDPGSTLAAGGSSAREGPHFRLGDTLGLEFRQQFLLARRHAGTEVVEVKAGGARLGEQAFRPLLFLGHVMLDLLGEHRDLRVVEFLAGV